MTDYNFDDEDDDDVPLLGAPTPEFVEEEFDSDEHGFVVTLPSGAPFRGGLSEDEAKYLDDRAKRYVDDNHFVNVSDLQDVDKLVIYELLIMRWSQQIATGFNSDGTVIDDEELRKSMKDLSGELRQLKKALGVDKQTRDKERGEDSVAAYIANLRRRAREFGIKRDEECDKALELFNQLKALVALHDNADEIEARELKATTKDVIDWIRDVAIPEYDRIDEWFRNQPEGQKYWRGSL